MVLQSLKNKGMALSLFWIVRIFILIALVALITTLKSEAITRGYVAKESTNMVLSNSIYSKFTNSDNSRNNFLPITLFTEEKLQKMFDLSAKKLAIKVSIKNLHNNKIYPSIYSNQDTYEVYDGLLFDPKYKSYENNYLITIEDGGEFPAKFSIEILYFDETV